MRWGFATIYEHQRRTRPPLVVDTRRCHRHHHSDVAGAAGLAAMSTDQQPTAAAMRAVKKLRPHSTQSGNEIAAIIDAEIRPLIEGAQDEHAVTIGDCRKARAALTHARGGKP